MKKLNMKEYQKWVCKVWSGNSKAKFDLLIEYSKNHWLLAAAAVGSFVGTYLVVKYSKHKRG